MTVKIFSLSDPVIAALETSLSPERMATYVTAAGGDRERALRLYTWNTAASAAFYGPLQGLEIALRNAMHRELSKTYGSVWYDNPACGFDTGTENRIAATKEDLRRDGYPVDPPHFVAALSFGFWVTLLGRGGRSHALGGIRQNYEMTLWRPCLFRAFPHAKLSRRAAHTPLDYLRTFRNRIAHHEPIFARHLAADFQHILTITDWISPDSREWIAHHSRVEEILKLPTDDPDLKF
ncbi:MAG: hypothetical protein WCC64_21775 [Aliidongia sp.]